MFTAHSYQEDWGLIQTGGHDGGDKDIVDLSSDGKNWYLLPTRIPDGLFKWEVLKIIYHQSISQVFDMAIAR